MNNLEIVFVRNNTEVFRVVDRISRKVYAKCFADLYCYKIWNYKEAVEARDLEQAKRLALKIAENSLVKVDYNV